MGCIALLGGAATEGDINFVPKWINVGKSQSDMVLIGINDKIRVCRLEVPSRPKRLLLGAQYRRGFIVYHERKIWAKSVDLFG